MTALICVTLTSVVTCCSPLHEYPTLYISLLSLSSVFGIRTFFVAVQWLALLPQRQKVLGSNTLASQMEAFCVELVHSPCASVGSLQLLPTVQKHSC